MSSIASRTPQPFDLPAGQALHNGDRMSQEEFHRRYEAYPEDVKFELIGGIVYTASPLRRAHGRQHIQLASLLERYVSASPGVEALDNATTILGEDSEPRIFEKRYEDHCQGSRLAWKE